MSETKKVLTKSLCILISGKAGVGKTTSANFAVKYLHSSGFLSPGIFSFADGVKKSARECFDWDNKKDEKGRQLLQNIGKTGRDYDKDIWIKQVLRKYYSYGIFTDFLIVDDWRFPNEADYIIQNALSLKVVTIRVESPEREILKGTEQYDDISETALPSIDVWEGEKNAFFYEEKEDYNYVIINIGTLDDLAKMIETILEKEITKLIY